MSAPTPPPSSAPAPAVLHARFEAAGGKPTYVRRMFGRIARVYDLMNRVMTAGLDGRWRAFAVRQIALGPGQTALDIGTGTGDLALALARASSPDAHITGVDFVPEMLAIAAEKVRRRGLDGRITFQQGDGEGLAFPDNSFDACCSAFVVRNLADLSRGFAEMLRVTKAGGKVVCLEMSHPRNPVFGAAFHLYFDRAVPLLGRVIGRSAEAYAYLPTSVSAFPDAPALKRLMEAAGWRDVHYWYRFGGAVAVHVGTKPRI
ncbi:MAG TPA: class I SAM-dependent methyltransferase [Ktedonobacterales bacterium]|nr:class I SAM-dependent methyltransferase [Ktedonobacterales bacterium]